MMFHKTFKDHLKKHAKRIHLHIQNHGHKRILGLSAAFAVVLVYPYFSNAQVLTGDDSSVVLGCMDDTATNFNTGATEDDGTCEYTGTGDVVQDTGDVVQDTGDVVQDTGSVDTGDENTGNDNTEIITCTTGIIITTQNNGDTLGGTFPITWTAEDSCDYELSITIQLYDHNQQWINIGTGLLGDMTHDFISTVLTDTENTMYTGAITGDYNTRATGYMVRIQDQTGNTLAQNTGTFSIDNQVPIVSDLGLSISNVVSGYVGRLGEITLSITSSETLSGASFNVLGTTVVATAESISETIYTYTIPMSTIANTGTIALTATVADIAGNSTTIFGTSTVIFDNRLPQISNMSLTGASGSVILSRETDQETIYTFSYNESGNSTPIISIDTIYGTMHNYTMSGIELNKVYIFALTAKDVLGNSKALSGDMSLSETGSLIVNIYQENQDVYQLSQQVELTLYNEILKREIEKFQVCRDAVTINKQTIQIGDKTVEIEVPVIEKESVKTIVQAFLLFFINKTEDTTLSQTELDETVLKMNNFFIILKLLRDDEGQCEQNMSNYYVAQFNQILEQTQLFITE